jgi:hypothetical protein
MLMQKVVQFYIDGFRDMRLGKTLWLIILIKLFLFFVVLKGFFFPNFLNKRCETDEEKARYVSTQLTERRIP